MISCLSHITDILINFTLYEVLLEKDYSYANRKLLSDRLHAYYIFIHSYFPIFPPPGSEVLVDQPKVARDFEPSSPVSLAVSAILALIPHPDDHDHSSEQSLVHRRDQAQAFAQCALEAIEIESELPESAINPSKALNGTYSPFLRERFHPEAPRELEAVQALAILSVYEYAQRGNIAKMRTRAGQALVAAMNLSLHKESEVEDSTTEARRRAWWMTVRRGK